MRFFLLLILFIHVHFSLFDGGELFRICTSHFHCTNITLNFTEKKDRLQRKTWIQHQINLFLEPKKKCLAATFAIRLCISSQFSTSTAYFYTYAESSRNHLIDYFWTVNKNTRFSNRKSRKEVNIYVFLAFAHSNFLFFQMNEKRREHRILRVFDQQKVATMTSIIHILFISTSFNSFVYRIEE